MNLRLSRACVVAIAMLAGCADSGDARSGSTSDTATTTALPSTTNTTSTTVAASTAVPTTTAAATTNAPPSLPDAFSASVDPVSAQRLGLSWRPGCPVSPDDLRLVTMTYHSFDGDVRMGEMVVHRKVADNVVQAFRELFELGFPIHKMVTTDRYIEPSDIAPDGSFIETHEPDTENDTSAFLCRPTTGSSGWSQHSYGTAIDINPVQNPYVKGTLVIPENGTPSRTQSMTGQITADSKVVEIMNRAGFKWGGNWNSLKDYMHFSTNGH